jgi:hypothetical protein
LTLKEYSAAKGIPVDVLVHFELSEIRLGGRPVLRIPYLGVDGEEVAVRLRFALTGTPKSKWRRNDKAQLYGLWRLQAAREAGHVTICEGESDCHTLWFHEIPALGIPGASTWRESWAAHLDGINTIYVVIEPDGGGEAVSRWLSRSAIRDRVRLVRLGEHKDPSGLYLADRDGFRSRWKAVCEAAERWTDQQEAQHRDEAEQAYGEAHELLHDPDLFERLGRAISAGGYAGDVQPPLLIYLALTSRLLERPMNLVVVAQSAAGKNAAIDRARAFVPEESVYVERAGSARALVYTDEDFQHRVVLVCEADSLPEDGPAAAAVRSLAADNVMEYDVVERDETTGKHGTRRITKPGPTALLTTSTTSLRTQLGTRHLEIGIRDDEQQVRDVMRAHARTVMENAPSPVDCGPFLAVQTWLALRGERHIVVPFAEVLSQLIRATPVRMNRDFRQLLTAIQSSAFLHQLQRDRTASGAVIATRADYGIAYTLLSPVFDMIAAEGVTPAIRQTVEAVGEEETLTQAALAKRLGLTRSTTSWRVGRAVKAGYLRRLKDKQITRGGPLPEARSVLPTPEEVAAEFECSNTNGDAEQPPPPPHGANGAGGGLADCDSCGEPTRGRDAEGHPLCPRDQGCGQDEELIPR